MIPAPGTVAVGVDPGGRHTGVAVRSGDLCHAQHVFTRDRDEPLEGYLAATRAAIVAVTNIWSADLVAVEDVNEPTGHLGGINVRGILWAAQMLAAVEAAVVASTTASTIRVPPANFGRSPLATYPAELVGPRETTGAGKGPRQHARAAWDVAGAGYTLRKLVAAWDLS